MEVQPVPESYHTVTPYLVVQGVPRLIEWMEEALGAMQRFRSEAPDGTIMNAEVMIGDSIIMMGEAQGPWEPRPGAFYMYVPDTDAVYQRALEAGAESVMEPADQFYGDRNAGVRDPAGNLWWIATHIEDVTPEEISRRARLRGR